MNRRRTPSAREALTTALYRTGATRLLAFAASRVHVGVRAGRGPGFMVLAYHRVNDDGDPFLPAVPTPVFERQMAYIARTWRVLPVEDLVDRLTRGRFPRNALAITFDDGYRDTLTHAAPILAKHGLPATVFLATGFIGTAEVPWFDRVALALKLTTEPSVAAPSGDRLPLSSAAARLAALGRTIGELKQLPDDACRQAVEVLIRQLGVNERRSFKNLMLSWDDVHALMGLGFSVGAHTVNHPILSRVSTRRAWTEIMGSKTMIEVACGRSPRAFAYPNGRPEDYNDTVTRLVREAGFTCAVTTQFGLNTGETPVFELRRGGPWEAHLPTFALKLAWYRMVMS